MKVRDELADMGVKLWGPHRVCFTVGKFCLDCKKHVKTNRDMERHIRGHDPSLQFKCPYCPHSGSNYQSFCDHVQKHLTGKSRRGARIVCSAGCGKRFATKAGMESHVSEGCSGDPILPVKCRWCPVKVGTRAARATHMRHCPNNPTRKPFLCNYCGAELASKASLRHHVLGHLGGSAIVCPLCQRPFPNHNQLADHKAVCQGPE